MEELVRVSTTEARLKEVMRETGKKQTDLVNDTGLNKSIISRCVSGKTEPGNKTVMLLAKALNVSEMWLWGYDVPKERSQKQKKTDKVSQVFDTLLRDPTLLDIVVKLVQMDSEQRIRYMQIIELLDKKQD